MIRDHNGEEWLTVAEAAARVFVLPGTIYVWIHRRKVAAHKINGESHVRFADVARAEAEWRASGRVRGSRTARLLDDRRELS